MNIFIIGINNPLSSTKLINDITEEIKQIFYPTFDNSKVYIHDLKEEKSFVAGVHSNPKKSNPKSYVHSSEKEILLYSGLPVDKSSKFRAHIASELLQNWKGIEAKLEGNYCLVKCSKTLGTFDIILDPIGFEQVYYYKHGNSWFISNSVLFIEKFINKHSYDPVSISTMLTLGEISADFTLNKYIKVFKGGQHLKWERNKSSPTIHNYYDIAHLSNLKKENPTESYFNSVAEELLEPIVQFSKYFPNIEIPLSGGIDSRVIAAAVENCNLKLQYYTVGSKESSDVKIASELSNKFNLKHEVRVSDSKEVTSNWNNLAYKTISRNDGMLRLWQMGDIYQTLQNRNFPDLVFSGIGGEVGRALYYTPKSYFKTRNNLDFVKQSLVEKFVRSNNLLKKELNTLTVSYLGEVVDNLTNLGFSNIDIFDAYSTFYKFPRIGGTNIRKMSPVYNSFLFYGHRKFIETAFGIKSFQRLTEPIHYNLTKIYDERFLSVGVNNKPWKNQSVYLYSLNLYVKILTNKLYDEKIKKIFNNSEKKQLPKQIHFDHFLWFEKNINLIREICLDQSNSDLWNFINRSRFEEIMSSNNDQEDRRKNIGLLYSIITLFYYEDFLSSKGVL